MKKVDELEKRIEVLEKQLKKVKYPFLCLIADANKKVDTGETEDWLVELREIVARGLSESAPYQYLQLSDLIRKTLAKERESLIKEIDPFDLVQECNPDCTPVEHAYHQGTWDSYLKLEKKLSTLKQKGQSEKL